MIPGMVLNWRRTSSTMAIAASPTARMARERENEWDHATYKQAGQHIGFINIDACYSSYSYKGRKQGQCGQCRRSNGKTFTGCGSCITHGIKDIRFSRTSEGSSLISAIPPALSAMGPNVDSQLHGSGGHHTGSGNGYAIQAGAFI